jgi:hypothetical protein
MDLYQAVLGKYSTARNRSIATTKKKKGRAPQNFLHCAIFQVSDASQSQGLRSASPIFFFA